MLKTGLLLGYLNVMISIFWGQNIEMKKLRIGGRGVPMNVPLCQHVKPDGSRCGTPAIRDHKYCYHHTTVRKLVPKTDLYGLHNPGTTGEPYERYELPFLESGEAIQIGFMQLIHGVATGLIDGRRGQIMLAALYGAAANLREMNKAAARAKAAQAIMGRPFAKKKAGSVKGMEVDAEETA